MAAAITQQRLFNQCISQPAFETLTEVITWLGAVQAQDYGAAKWALGLRLPGAADVDIEQAFSEGTILRTHVMRPTWHFVTPADIRWMLALTAPRVGLALATYDRKIDLDSAVLARSRDVLAKTLQGGKQLTRPELVAALEQDGIAADELRAIHLLMHAELAGILCSGGRRGKQFTYALLDERVPPTRTWTRDEALAELTRRYFLSHGPATVPDFVWWSGLTVADAKAGLDMIKSQLVSEVIDNQTYWFAASMPTIPTVSPTAYWLPNYDEYLVGYTDRSAIFDATHMDKLDARGNVLFNHTIVVNGQIVGTWKRTLRKSAVVIEPTLFTTLTAAQNDAVTASAQRYGQFLGLPVVMA